MKRLLIISMLALLGMTQAVAQEYEYVPFVREGVKWVYYYIYHGNPFSPDDPNLALGKVYLTLEFRGDTVINGKAYKAMHKYFGDAINEENDTVPIYMRDEDKKVYGIVTDSKHYRDCPIGIGGTDDVFEKISNHEEFILYDFNDPTAYLTELLGWEDEFDTYFFNTLSIDTISVGNHLVKRFFISHCDMSIPLFSIIEGIGFDSMARYNTMTPGLLGYTLFPIWKMGGYSPYFALSHVIEDGEIIYKATGYGATDGIDEVVADKTSRPLNPNYYNLMGLPVGKDIPTVPGIYIHHGKKIVVR